MVPLSVGSPDKVPHCLQIFSNQQSYNRKRSVAIPSIIIASSYEATLHLCLVNLLVELVFDPVGQLEPDDRAPMKNRHHTRERTILIIISMVDHM